jgi:NAD(P)H-hydrate epimerase
MKLIDVSKMKELESAANSGGYSFEKMMIQAGANLARLVHERYQAATELRALGLVGGGNNGGDTLVALTELKKAGWSVCAVLVQKDTRAHLLVQQLLECGGRIAEVDRLDEELKGAI